jgi:hypothetical protein
MCFLVLLAFLNFPLFLLDESPRHTIDCLLTLAHNKCRIVRLVGRQRRMASPRSNPYEEISYYRGVCRDRVTQGPRLGNRDLKHILICIKQLVVFVFDGIEVIVES